jgi:hypothetical protein
MGLKNGVTLFVLYMVIVNDKIIFIFKIKMNKLKASHILNIVIFRILTHRPRMQQSN